MSFREAGLRELYSDALDSFEVNTKYDDTAIVEVYRVELNEHECMDELLELLDVPAWAADIFRRQRTGGVYFASRVTRRPDINPITPEQHFVQCALRRKSSKHATQLRQRLAELKKAKDHADDQKEGEPQQKFTGRAGGVACICPPKTHIPNAEPYGNSDHLAYIRTNTSSRTGTQAPHTARSKASHAKTTRAQVQTRQKGRVIPSISATPISVSVKATGFCYDKQL